MTPVLSSLPYLYVFHMYPRIVGTYVTLFSDNYSSLVSDNDGQRSTLSVPEPLAHHALIHLSTVCP